MTIISEKKDVSTNKVGEFVINKRVDFKRINQEDTQLESQLLQLTSTVSWLRRGNFPSSFQTVSAPELVKEYQNLNRYFHYLAEQNPNCLGSLVREYDHNKLIDLHKAKSVGLLVPETHIVCTKEELKELFSQPKTWITKSIKDPILVQEDGKTFSAGFTSEVTETILIQLPDTFYPSLLQEQITKEVEIRVFYLKEKFYPMAIFSQNDKQTAIDYRHYNQKRPNRNVPFILPKDVEQKLILLMEKLELNTGSIDLILDKQGNYVFLEVNPVGQFDWLSMNCNYSIEQDIAKIIIE